MKVAIWPNLEKNRAFETAISVCKKLYGQDVQLIMEECYSEPFQALHYITFCGRDALLNDVDFAIAIGGDGTILRLAAEIFRTHSTAKLVGINTGRLGFLAGMEADEIDLLDKLFSENYAISERMVLKMFVNSTETHYAMNDIYASRLGGRICDFSVFVDDLKIGTFRADGIIFSTPTGSTAYALSAGGPVMEPDLSLIEMNLICPHSLFARPMLFSPSREIRVEYTAAGENDLLLHVDGSTQIRISHAESFTVTAAKERVPFVNFKGSAFYDALNGKLMRPIKDDSDR